MNTIQYVIGDACHGKIYPNQGSVLYDWEIYVDVTKGDVDLLRKVAFQIKCGNRTLSQASRCPTKSGSNWRYQIRKQTEGPIKVAVKMIGYKDTAITTKVSVGVVLPRDTKWSRPYRFHAPAKPDSLRPNPILDCNFGIELELSTSFHLTADNVARILSSSTSTGVKDLTKDFAQAKRRSDIWRLMTDTSISCPRGGECSKFELVSPILKGSAGLTEVDNVLRALKTINSVEVGKSMGFHVHIDVSQLTCSQLVKVCQQFVKYERAMDSLMPPSRREDTQEYCKSNKRALDARHFDPHAAIATCATINKLADVMNPDNDRYYKLNLQNIATRRQPTLEFRQHSGSSNIFKIKNWIRFCMAFVHNSAESESPFPLKKTVDDDTLFEMLMVHVIDDRYLLDFYRNRRKELHANKRNGGEKASCCEGCATRGQCAGLCSTRSTASSKPN